MMRHQVVCKSTRRPPSESQHRRQRSLHGDLTCVEGVTALTTVWRPRLWSTNHVQ